jgi:menaquinone-dependent protoporphyrinogen oxidase
MSRVLVAYASTHGHTAKVARRIAETLEATGLEVDVLDVASRADGDPSDYDAVVAGASLHSGRHQPEMIEWARRHCDALSAMPSAFFSVSLTAAEESEQEREPALSCIAEFIEETGWRPARTEAVAGALQYLEYDPFTRTLIQLMMKRGGRPTDASRDYDYTDWDGVERFASELAGPFASRGAAA